MLKISKKILLAGIAALLLVPSVTAAPKKKQTKDEKAQAKQLETQFKKAGYVVKKNSKGKVWDFGGMEVIVGDWWNNPKGTQADEAKTPVQEDTQKFHNYIMNTYNCKIDQYGISSWGAHPQTVANFCTTGGDENYVFVIDGRSISAGLKANLFYDLSSIKTVDWNDPKWVSSVRDKMTKGNSFYGCRAIPPEARGGVWFNKRLLQEAGINPDEPYDLQKSGKWTWAEFERMLKATTRDVDNDGVIDTWGMQNLSPEICHLAVMTNGSAWVGKDKNGKYYSMVGDEKTLEALTWVQKIAADYGKPTPEGANWDWFYAAFINGELAFQVDQEYRKGNMADMKDDFGFVCFPLGPKGDKKYKTLHDDNTFVIPACYAKDRAENIMKIFDLWSDLTPGWPADSWKEDYYPRYRDSRAVDETLVLMTENGIVRYDTLISGLDLGAALIWGVYGGWLTPQEGYEQSKNSIESLINEANR